MKKSTNKNSPQILKTITEATLKLASDSASLKTESVGIVEEAGDGIAFVQGLSGVMYNELLLFPKQTYCLALNLEPNRIGVIFFSKALILNKAMLSAPLEGF